MILVLVLVGDEYIEEAKPHINRYIEKGWKIEVLTDQPQKFKNFLNIELHIYNRKIFSYFEKILFPLQIIKKYGDGVLYIDSSILQLIPDSFLETFEPRQDFLYYNTWPNGKRFENIENDPYFENLIKFFKYENFNNYGELLNILEWIYYIPYNKNKINDLIYDTERIKPIFEYTSIFYKTKFNGIGNGEGLGLSYILFKNSIKINKFNNLVF
jgi:hypothetical protein